MNIDIGTFRIECFEVGFRPEPSYCRDDAGREELYAVVEECHGGVVSPLCSRELLFHLIEGCLQLEDIFVRLQLEIAEMPPRVAPTGIYAQQAEPAQQAGGDAPPVSIWRDSADQPEADREGYLRSFRSLIQMIGRVARNEAGRVILLRRPDDRQHRYRDARDIAPASRSDGV